MILRQKEAVRPESYGGEDERPFRPGPWKTGVLARHERPEYLGAYVQRLPVSPRLDAFAE